MSPRVSILTFIAMTAAVAGCKNDTNFIDADGPPSSISDLDPDINVTPEKVKFGEMNVLVDAPLTSLVTIENVGEGDLEIHDLYIDPSTGPSPFEISALGSVLIPPGSSTDFQVTFAPKTAETWKTSVIIESNDPDESRVDVKLVGTGLAPVIDVTPTVYDFGVPYIGCDIAQPFLVTNVGTAPLEVSSFKFASGSIDMKFDPNGEASRTIDPTDSFTVFINYKALDTFSDKGFLTVFSNDPMMPETVVTTTGAGTPFMSGKDAFEQPLRSSSDILFVIDTSGSMTEEQAGLTDNFESFMTTLVDSDADYQLAVITTDIADGGNFRGDIIDSSTSDAVGEFQSQALAGVMGSGDERGTQTAYMATQSGGEAEPGGDFMRDRSMFSIVIVTDENDNSINTPAPYTSEEDYYDYFVNDVKDGDADAFRYHGIIGELPVPTCSTAAMGGTGYVDIIALSGGTQGSVCDPDWGASLSTVATGTVSLNNTFELANEPVPETIEVRVDGVLTTVGWTYSAATNTVDFEADFVPMGGSTIDVDYQIMPTCEG